MAYGMEFADSPPAPPTPEPVEGTEPRLWDGDQG